MQGKVVALLVISVLLHTQAFCADVVGSAADAVMEPPLAVENILQVALSLFAVVVLIGVIAWFFRRFGRMNSAICGELRVVGGISIGQRERVVVIQVGEEQLLVGVTPGRVQTLHVLTKNIAEQSATSTAGHETFAVRLAAAMHKKAPK